LPVKVVGEPGAFELNEDLLLETSMGGGGTAKAVVLATDKAGVNGAPEEVVL
jgi:shikimate 5-dehydrogenase